MCERNMCLYLCPCLCLFLRLCSGFDCICGSVCVGDLFYIKWPRGDGRKHKPRRDTLEVALLNKVVASGGGVTDCLGRREKLTWVVQGRGRYDLLELLHIEQLQSASFVFLAIGVFINLPFSNREASHFFVMQSPSVFVELLCGVFV